MNRARFVLYVAATMAMLSASCSSDSDPEATPASSAPAASAAAGPAASTAASPAASTAASPAATTGATTGATTAAGAESTAAPADFPDQLAIVAPADPGGGWDSTARAMQVVLDPIVDGSVEVSNRPGAGGTVGLAEFVGKSGSAEDLMVMGSVMVGAIITNDSPVTLDEVTPIASLTTEYLAIAVPADSELQSIDDLIAAFEADPLSVSWGGGSAGGSDHQLVALIAQAVGLEAGDINYIAHAGGGELLATMLSGAVSVGVSGVSEFSDQVAAGELRFLAISSPEPLPDVDAPTIASAGYDVSLSNWRGVVAPGDLADEDRASLLALIDEMVKSPEWTAELERNGWRDFYQAGAEFESFLSDEAARVATVLVEIGLV